LQLQEAELAKLHHEAETTKRRIVEVRWQAQATASAAAEHAQHATDVVRREEARHAIIKEDAAKASAIAAETAKLAAAQALAKAREHEHMLVVQATIALKVQHDKDLAREKAAKEATGYLAGTQEASPCSCMGADCETSCGSGSHNAVGATGSGP